MKVLMFILAIIAVIASFAIQGVAKSAIHEIYAGLMLLIAAVLLSGAAIVRALDRVENRLANEDRG